MVFLPRVKNSDRNSPSLRKRLRQNYKLNFIEWSVKSFARNCLSIWTIHEKEKWVASITGLWNTPELRIYTYIFCAPIISPWFIGLPHRKRVKVQEPRSGKLFIFSAAKLSLFHSAGVTKHHNMYPLFLYTVGFFHARFAHPRVKSKVSFFSLAFIPPLSSVLSLPFSQLPFRSLYIHLWASVRTFKLYEPGGGFSHGFFHSQCFPKHCLKCCLKWAESNNTRVFFSVVYFVTWYWSARF